MAYPRSFRFDVAGMKQTTFFITGTDTGVGKTVLTALLARHLRERGVNAAEKGLRALRQSMTILLSICSLPQPTTISCLQSPPITASRVHLDSRLSHLL